MTNAVNEQSFVLWSYVRVWCACGAPEAQTSAHAETYTCENCGHVTRLRPVEAVEWEKSG